MFHPTGMPLERGWVGRIEGDEVVQAYVAAEQRAPRTPLRALAAFVRVHLAPGESKTVELHLPPQSFTTVTDQGAREYRPGKYAVSIGGGQPLGDVVATSDFTIGRVELAPQVGTTASP